MIKTYVIEKRFDEFVGVITPTHRSTYRGQYIPTETGAYDELNLATLVDNYEKQGLDASPERAALAELRTRKGKP